MAISSRKIAITSCGDSRVSQIYERFGRTYWLLIYDPADDSWQAIDNRLNRNCSRGAGVATATEAIRSGANVVLTGETGPKAFRTLRAAGIEVVQNISGSVFEVVQSWLEGALVPATAANDAGSPDCLMVPSRPGRDSRRKGNSTPVGRAEVDGGR
jgi:predicted Fe-Mo cluster-binding NifX family protein